MDEISVALITKNEAGVLPRLLDSLSDINDIVVLDTGSTDDTVKIAKSRGCNVIEVGEKFKIKATQSQYNLWINKFGYEPSFKVGEGYFNFSKARNYALKFTKNDWVFQPDADEVVEWDFNKVKEVIQNEDQLEYRFCYQHTENGACGLEFTHSKFFRKSKLKWTKWVHEIHTPVEGQTPKLPKFVDFIYHHHYQESKAERGNYLPGLELSVLENSDDDRNVYYLAREYFYRNHFDKSIKMFEKAIKINNWAPEKGQAYIFKGLCHKNKGEVNEAIKCFHESMIVYHDRRDAFWELGNLYRENNDFSKAITYYLAATSIPFKVQGYINSKELYGWKIEDCLAYCYDQLHDKENARKHWLEAIKYNPPDIVLINGFNYFYNGFKPKVSIIVPTVRKDGYLRLEKSIKDNTLYDNYEIIKLDDDRSAIVKFNEGVEKSTSEFVVYLGDDCEVTKGWIIKALSNFKEHFGNKGLVIFNDNHWHGTLANHFLCSKNIKDELGGKIWNEDYFHCSADVELYCRLKEKRLISYAESAVIKHHHYFANSEGVSKDKKDKWTQLIEEHMDSDRKLLPQNLWKLGLKDDAIKYQQWYDKTLQGDPTSPERTVVGKIVPIPSYEYTRYKWASDNAIGKTVLDIGCSSGFGSRLFKKFDYTGIDYNEKIVEFANDQYKSDKTKFIYSTIERFLEKNPDFFFDNVVIFECLEHLKETKKIAQELKKHCKKLFATVPYKEPPGAWGKYHLNHNLQESDFPGFTYKWMHRDGKVYNEPDPNYFNLMYLFWENKETNGC